MNARRFNNQTRLLFFCGVVLFFLMPAALAQLGSETEDSNQEASPSGAQATMASLFGRGAKMPAMPRIGGTLALPSFDSSALKIDGTALDEAQRGERATGTGER